ncbi:hypothetical protein CANARDRAFT_26218 [[Candida] arabinofermentans NRRL YB-2248]|uniref:Proteasome assembly chaperone 2 n=1 Tax=[Candida] arabinofermentans NRRL YB-2248 TaxID=983967 RepID=A0A1E4T8G5_9ASCO|nr:hypothetical protein CANARDRAFT_26218 [[Candida] arabinofermentans NRRL YB-2248]
MSFHSLDGLNPLDTLNKLTNSQLVLPLVSIGNISQLAIDLLIHNISDIELVGRLDDLYLYPFASPIDYSINDSPKKGISSALEIYFSESHNLTLLQQRSPILPGFTSKFITELIQPFISNVQFSKVVILQSNDQGLKIDKYADNRFQIWSNDLTKNFELLEIQEKSNIGLTTKASEISTVGEYLVNILEGIQSSPLGKNSTSSFELIESLNPGSSINLSDVDPKQKPALSSTSSPELIILSIFVYEGDNTDDAELLANQVLNLSSIKQISQWQTPKSWAGVYGDKSIPVGIEYGLYT